MGRDNDALVDEGGPMFRQCQKFHMGGSINSRNARGRNCVEVNDGKGRWIRSRGKGTECEASTPQYTRYKEHLPNHERSPTFP